MNQANLLISYLAGDLLTDEMIIIESIRENGLVDNFRACLRGEIDYDTFLHQVNEIA